MNVNECNEFTNVMDLQIFYVPSIKIIGINYVFHELICT